MSKSKRPWLASTQRTYLNKETRKFRDSALWRHKVRPEKLRRNPECEICLTKDKQTEAKEVDHVTPIALGGHPYDFDNLQSLCSRCHIIKTSNEQRKP